MSSSSEKQNGLRGGPGPKLSSSSSSKPTSNFSLDNTSGSATFSEPSDYDNLEYCPPRYEGLSQRLSDNVVKIFIFFETPKTSKFKRNDLKKIDSMVREIKNSDSEKLRDQHLERD